MNKVRLGDVSEVITKGTTPTSIGYDFQNSGINFIKIESIAENGSFLKDKFSHISGECNESLKRSQLRCNDLLFSIAGAIGRVAIVDDSILPANTNQALAIIRIPEGMINYNYLYYFLKSEAVIKQYSRKKQGVAQINLSLKDISDLIISVPSLYQQNKIVKTLSFLDDLIKKANQQKEKLDELIKSRFVEMFGDPINNPRNWERKSLRQVCIKLTDGTHFSPESFSKGDYKYITAKNIKKDGFDFSNLTYVPAEVHTEIYARCNPEKGDVLYIKDGVTTGIAMVNTLDEPFTMLSSVALLKHNRSMINNYYLASILNNEHMYDSIRGNMGGAAITRLTIAKLNAIKIPVPPLELQNHFADFVTQVEKQKATVQQSIDKLETLKKSLMQEYFG